MSRLGRIGHRLYTGEVSYNFLGRRRRWYTISSILIAVCVAAVLILGLNWGIEFKGGADFKAPATVTDTTVPDMRAALEATGVADIDEATINTIGGNQVRVQTRTLDPVDEVPKVRSAIAEEVGIGSDTVAYSLIGASWGDQITQRALIALVVFLALVSLVIWAYFRNAAMAVAALVALAHDLIVTIGVYALSGFTVTPATVIGVLTILGYSLYDTVVVFDKVRENVRDLRSGSVRTYSEAANLAVNQVLVRSINTTVIGVLPVAALLFTGGVILGEGPLKDLALALFVGMVSGAYSSIFIATPLLAQLRERDPEMRKLAARVAARRTREQTKARSGSSLAPAPAAPATAGPRRAAASLGEPEGDQSEGHQAGGVETPRAKPRRNRADPPPPAPEGTTDSPAAPADPDGPRVTVTSGAHALGARPRPDGAARRPQPQHRPRSQRKH